MILLNLIARFTTPIAIILKVHISFPHGENWVETDWYVFFNFNFVLVLVHTWLDGDGSGGGG